MISKEDAESNARLVEALFGGADEAVEALKADKDTPSHMQLDYGEDGEPLLLRFAYVDEHSCIGCTYCADVARSTFYMNEDAGRARVFKQGGDDPEVIMEAIDTCPVNCISFVDLEDLIILETEREGMTINPASAGIPATWSVSMNGIPPTEAKIGKMGGGGALTCCNNCPSRGCKECPMYGVGLNPVYMERQEERKRKKEASGAAAKERRDSEVKETLDAYFRDEAADEPTGVVVPVELSAAEPSDAFFDALYGPPAGMLSDDFGVEDDDMMPVPLGLGALDPALVAEASPVPPREAAEESDTSAAGGGDGFGDSSG